jgi:excisionase family DNA binding protein
LAPSTGGSDGLWDIHDVAGYLQLSVHAIYKMTARLAAVRIPHIRIGHKLRFRRSDVDRWLTLLTVSNLEILSKMREKVSKVTHGHDSQTPAR